jgi:hypothetical protein
MKFGEVSLWRVAGPATEVCAQMRSLLDEVWGNNEYESCEEMERLPVDADYFFSSFFFLGTCRQKARPVFIVYSKDKSFRDDIVGSMRGLDWLDSNKSGVVATTWYNPVIRQAIIEANVRYNGWDRGFAEEVY